MSAPALDNRSISDLASALEGPIAVFGAGGFIGTNLVEELSKSRSDVYSITHQPYLPWRLADIHATHVLRCDITDSVAVRDLFRTHKFRTVLFFAAYGAYSKQRDTNLIYETNINGLLNVLAASEEQGVAAFIHAGSQSEYGLNCSGSAEDWDLKPNSHYSVTKVAASYMIQFWGQQKKLPAVNLRIYSAFGPWEEPDRLIPVLVQSGLNKQYPSFVDPEISRDFAYVTDIVRATLLAAIRGVKTACGESINIASGVKTTMRQVAETSKRLFNLEGEPQWGSMQNRSWDLKDWYGDPSYAKEALGWVATTSFEEGLAKTIE
jgi:dolichol-phosphate mannosyltransferase